VFVRHGSVAVVHTVIMVVPKRPVIQLKKCHEHSARMHKTRIYRPSSKVSPLNVLKKVPVAIVVLQGLVQLRKFGSRGGNKGRKRDWHAWKEVT
jgi:hypothetical protein